MGPSYEIVIAGKKDEADTAAMFKAVRSNYLPNKVVLFRPIDQADPEIIRLAEFTRYQKGQEGKATVYICLNYRCKRPITNIDELLKFFDEGDIIQ